MAKTPTLAKLVSELNERVNRAEERAAQAEARAAGLEERLSQKALTLPSTPLRSSPKGERNMSRSRFLKAAGAAAAGAVGAALLEARGTKDAYATTTDTNFVATGITGGGGNGVAAAQAAAFSVGGYLYGSDYGVYANGYGSFGQGVNAQGTKYGVTAYSPGGVGFLGQGLRGAILAGTWAPLNLTPAMGAGPPTTNYHNIGDLWLDSAGTVWTCVASGGPGSFAPLQEGGLNNAFFQAISTQQYTLVSSDGATWADMDSTSATPLLLNITPRFNSMAILSANCDLWTANAGYNQDIGIFISGGTFGSGRVVAWKESGGYAGAYSPNAALLETAVSLAAGTPYTIKVQWKTNKPAPGVTIAAGAGPIGTAFSPTRLGALLIATA